MIGVILAAGIGSRLRPLTSNKPKSLVKVNGKEIIKYQIESYIKAGIKKLIIIVGYEEQKLRSYLSNITKVDIKIIVNKDYESTNNMYSLYLAKEHLLGKNFILNNADLVIDTEIVSIILNDKNTSCIAVDENFFDEESMKVEIFDNGLISNISKEIKKEKYYATSIDFYKFDSYNSKVFFEKIKEIIETNKNKKDWTEVAMQSLFKSKEMHFHPCKINGYKWVEVDNYSDLVKADQVFSNYNLKKNSFKNYLIDLDGTVYIGSTLIDGAIDKINKLIMENKNIFFITNNSSINKKSYEEKLRKLGLITNKTKIITSTDILVNFLNENEISSAYIIGTESFINELKENGIKNNFIDPKYVIIAYDTELNYKKLKTACELINKGTPILATHADIFCPTENGPIPDAGAIIELIRLTTGKNPSKIFGKPNSEISKLIDKDKKFNKENTLVIGDRLYTDIKMAINCGYSSALVLSGDTNRSEIDSSHILPDYIFNSLSEI